TGPRIGGKLALRRSDRLGDVLEGRLVWIDQGGAVTRYRGGTAAALAEKTLHDPVLEAVKGDHREAAAGPQGALGSFEALLELVELGVQVNPDCLESARRGIGLLPLAETGGAADDRRQLGGTLNGTRGDDGAGDRPGARVLPIVAQDPGDLGLLGRIQIFGGGQAGTAHPHIERTVGLEREAALGPVELHRADADVERDRVDE